MVSGLYVPPGYWGNLGSISVSVSEPEFESETGPARCRNPNRIENRIAPPVAVHIMLQNLATNAYIYLSIYIYSNICIYTRANPHFHVPCGFVSVWVTFPPPYVKCLFIYMKMKTAKQSTDIRLLIPNRPSIDQPPAYLIARPPVHRPKPKPKPILNVRTPARPSIARPPA